MFGSDPTDTQAGSHHKGLLQNRQKAGKPRRDELDQNVWELFCRVLVVQKQLPTCRETQKPVWDTWRGTASANLPGMRRGPHSPTLLSAQCSDQSILLGLWRPRTWIPLGLLFLCMVMEISRQLSWLWVKQCLPLATSRLLFERGDDRPEHIVGWGCSQGYGRGACFSRASVALLEELWAAHTNNLREEMPTAASWARLESIHVVENCHDAFFYVATYPLHI